MRRMQYSNLLKMMLAVTVPVGVLLLLIYTICAGVIDDAVHVPSMVAAAVLMAAGLVGWLLDRCVRSGVVFDEEKMQYQGRVFYRGEIKVRYFSFSLNLFDMVLVIPKVTVNVREECLVLYLSWRDVKRLGAMGYAVSRV